MSEGLEIRALGGLTITLDGRPVTGLATRKCEALLLYLAYTRRSHPREVLAELFWPERDQVQAQANLRVTLSRLRGQFSPYLDISRQSVGWNQERGRPAARLDALELETQLTAARQAWRAGRELNAAERAGLERGLALYAGDFLAGVSLRDSPAFEEWAVIERERLRNLTIAALDRLVSGDLTRGDLAAGQAHASALLRLDPAREETHRQLMLLLARGGQRSAALAQFERCREALRSELGVEPEPETAALCERIRAGKEGKVDGNAGASETGSSGAARRETGSGAESRAAASRAPAVPGPGSLQAASLERPAADTTAVRASLFVGRAAELARFQGFLDRAVRGQGQVVLIAGEAGAGKTSLWQEAACRARSADQTLLVAAGGCREHAGTGDPYLPFREILRGLLGDPETAGLSGCSDNLDRALAALPITAPVLAEHAPALAGGFVSRAFLARQLAEGWPEGSSWLERLDAGEPGQAGGTGAGIFESYAEFLRATSARRPLLLALEDLHWADAGSIALLFHLAPRLAACRILLAVTYRPEDLAAGPSSAARHPAAAVLNDLRRRYGDMVVDLDHAAQAEGRVFVDAVLDAEPNGLDETFRRELYARTGGHPLFTVELLRDLQARGRLMRDDAGRWQVSRGLDWSTLPSRVEAVIAERIGRLDDEERGLLNAGCVEGEEFTAQVAGRVQNMAELECLTRLSRDLAARHRLVAEAGEVRIAGHLVARYRFSHALYRHYLYEQLGAGERRALHAGVAGALVQLHGPAMAEPSQAGDALLAALGHHYAAAGDPARAVPYLLAAGDRARELGAYADAGAAYQRAVDFLRECGELEQASRACMKLGLTYELAFDFRAARAAFDKGFTISQIACPRTVGARLPRPPHPLRFAWAVPPNLVSEGTAFVTVLPQIFSGLVQNGADMEILPDVAESWEISADGLRYVFHLRNDAVWSDGAPVTAADFVYAWQRRLAPDRPQGTGFYLHDIRGADDWQAGRLRDPAGLGVCAADPRTLVVDLAAPAAYFLHVLAYPGTYPLPRHVIERYGPSWTEPGKMVSNGPFQVEAWQPMKRMSLARNLRYHGICGGNVERIELYSGVNEEGRFYRDERLRLYEEGLVDGDLLWVLSGPVMERVQRYHAAEYVQAPTLWTAYLVFDARRPPFDDIRVRRAVVMSLDREFLANTVNGGTSLPGLGGILPPGMPGHSPGLSLKAGLGYDPDAARALLAAAGYPQGRGLAPFGMADPVGGSNRPATDYVRRAWQRELGVTVSEELVDGDALWARTQAGEMPQITVSGDSALYPDPDYFLRLNMMSWPSGWAPGHYWELVGRARHSLNVEERLGLYRAAEELLIGEVLVAPIYYGWGQMLLKPWIKGYRISPICWWRWRDIVIEPH